MTNHSHRYGAKQKVSETHDFEVILSCNRKSILDFQVKYKISLPLWQIIKLE